MKVAPAKMGPTLGKYILDKQVIILGVIHQYSLTHSVELGLFLFFFVFLALVVNTSCGLSIKTLRKTPMYVCGTYLVMLAPTPGVAGSSATRSLFGGSSGLSSLKSKSSSLILRGKIFIP